LKKAQGERQTVSKRTEGGGGENSKTEKKGVKGGEPQKERGVRRQLNGKKKVGKKMTKT